MFIIIYIVYLGSSLGNENIDIQFVCVTLKTVLSIKIQNKMDDVLFAGSWSVALNFLIW